MSMTDPTNYLSRFGGGKFVTFKQQPGGPPAAPYSWPQDVLKVPNAFGGVPIINALNANLDNREPFGLNVTFPLTSFPAGVEQTQIVTVPKDGDFWLDSLAVLQVEEGADFIFTNDTIRWLLQMTDVGAGYKFFPFGSGWDGASANAFNCNQHFAPGMGFANNPGQPVGAGSRTSWMQPYCFLRGTSIEFKLSNPTTAAGQVNNVVHINLMGWKEYTYAAAAG